MPDCGSDLRESELPIRMARETAEGIAGILPQEIVVDGLRHQQTAFCILTLFVLAMLLLLHAIFAFVLGEPSLAVLIVLGLSFAVRLAELTWLQSSDEPLSLPAARADGLASIGMLFLLAGLLAWLTNRDHSPYQVLLAVPVLQSAFLFGLPATIFTIFAADAGIFLWLWRYFVVHPPPSGKEYLEAGMLAIIYALIGILVWYLVAQLRGQQARLSGVLEDLQTAREQLVEEERLAAVGRLAGGIAHEIRNPVAMILSALSTAADVSTPGAEREEMFSIASRQARRLESLTTDFLTYARPREPHRGPVLVGDIIAAAEAAARVRIAGRGIQIECFAEEDRVVWIDTSQVEGALLNLALNAVDATPAGGTIGIAAHVEDGLLRVEVENSGSVIPGENLPKIFEPFFTTKAGGTGLGLAIARAVARSHGGDLWVGRNEDGRVVFTMALRLEDTPRSQEETRWAKF